MKRRDLLGGLAAGIVGLAGCQGSQDGETDGENSGGNGNDDSGVDGGNGGDGTDDAGSNGGTATSGSRGTTDPRSRFRDVSLPVSKSELNRGAAEDAIPAIVDPAFDEDWSGVRSGGQKIRLDGDDQIIGVERGGEARAYPLRILDWHEIVNDDFGGPLLVTFCPLCGSGVTAERRVDGEATVFGVSGLLFRNDLVMYDQATDSLWSQIMATAIRGPQTGETLSLVPSTFTTWGEWKDNHPETEVLRPPPESEIIRENARLPNYSREAYAGYDESGRIGIGGDNPDDRLHPKTRVLGIFADGVARAYPHSMVKEAGVVTDTVGSLPVVVAATGDDTIVAYVRRLDGETVEAARDGEFLQIDGSRFRLTDGVAIDGPHEGTQLERATAQTSLFWFAWADFHSETEIWGP